MFSGSNHLSHYSPGNMSIWLSMAFQAGTINAGGFLCCHRFVTHTTGFATLFGTEFAQGHMAVALSMLTVPLFFIFGTMVSAFLVDRRLAMAKQPLYHLIFSLISVMLIAVTIGGVHGFLGNFGDGTGTQGYILLAALCLCSGLQNATITSASGSVVRTTHLTGITTDLGIGLVRVFSARQHGTRKNEIRANWMRVGTVFFFAMGSMVAAFSFFQLQYWAFLIPATISFVLFMISMKKFKLPKMSVLRDRVS
jgi:uncharacterized membrane protein YoaK (UPF0700 family)